MTEVNAIDKVGNYVSLLSPWMKIPKNNIRHELNMSNEIVTKSLEILAQHPCTFYGLLGGKRVLRDKKTGEFHVLDVKKNGFPYSFFFEKSKVLLNRD